MNNILCIKPVIQSLWNSFVGAVSMSMESRFSFNIDLPIFVKKFAPTVEKNRPSEPNKEMASFVQIYRELGISIKG